MRSKALFILLVVPLLLLPRGSPGAASDPLRPRHSSAIALTDAGATLLVVNPDSNTLTLVDAESHSIVAELSVGIDPRTVAVDSAGRRAYVANRGSDSVSVVDLTAPEVIAEVPVGRRPYGAVVSPDDRWLYVAEQGIDRLAIVDTATLEIAQVVPVADRPSGLSIAGHGHTLYVTHLLDNVITVVHLSSPEIYLPLVLKRATAGQSQAAHGAAARSPAFRAQLSIPQPATSTIGLFPDSNLVQSVVLSPDGRRAYVPHTRSNSANPNLTFETTVAPLVSLIDVASGQHLWGQQLDLGSLDPPGVGLPFDATLTPDGSELWVVNAASNDLSVINLSGAPPLAAHIEVGDNPRGIVMAPDGGTAYVNNTLGGTVSVLDTATYTVTEVITVTEIPLPPVLLRGKRLFHSSDDPRMARRQWISCNSCHFEGEQDGQTWTFAFAGPRNTTSLLGMIQTYPLRWSGEWDESADSEFATIKENFGSGLIDGDLHCNLSPPDCVSPEPNQGRSYDMDSLALFLDSLEAPLSPGHAHGEPLTEAEQRGQALFSNPALGCVTCHPPPLYTDLQRHDVGTATSGEKIGPDYDTPTLLGLYDSAPYYHDGGSLDLHAALTRPSPGSEHDLSGLPEAQIQDLIAFLLALPYEH
ncbi:MAG TPA: cytochrome D1 domain-containing protein [Anaerolineae bacterium]|nr:cytochrome D1 domain-containing protein [Anaerolineae bacterium]